MSSLLDQNLLTNCLRVTQEEQPNGSITYFVNHYGERRLQSSIFILGSLQTIGCSCIGARHQLFLAKIFSLKRPSNLEKCSTSYTENYHIEMSKYEDNFLLIITAKKSRFGGVGIIGHLVCPVGWEKKGEIAPDDDDDAWVAHGEVTKVTKLLKVDLL